MIRRVVDGWVNRRSFDYLAVVTVAVLALALDPQNVPDSDLQSAWFQTLASVSGALLGLAGVAVTVVFAVTPSERLENAYQAVGQRLVRLIMSSLAGIAIATAGFLALFLIPTNSSELRNASTAAFVVLLVLRFTRLWWLFGRVLLALMSGDDERDILEPPEPKRWSRPDVGKGHYVVPTRDARRGDHPT